MFTSSEVSEKNPEDISELLLILGSAHEITIWVNLFIPRSIFRGN
jgi:hypothetical protein